MTPPSSPVSLLTVRQAEWLQHLLNELEGDRGELAEALKAEAEARASAYEHSPDTRVQGREHYASASSVEQAKETIDWKARVRTQEQWVDFWTLILKHEIPLEPPEVPQR